MRHSGHRACDIDHNQYARDLDLHLSICYTGRHMHAWACLRSPHSRSLTFHHEADLKSYADSWGSSQMAEGELRLESWHLWRRGNSAT